ncbi:MAG: MMPL family transporter [Candidatus Thiodiazotropha sp. (ex Epidulcina cf. delphinae)]|nr:MMPL family transporter [Candidatus Thiodiazotropha sp. (ex Epidulcina cf. delphinae)]
MRARRGIFLIWLIALLLTGWWEMRHLSLRTDLSLFLPQGGTAQERLLLDELNKGPATRLLMLGINGGDAVDRAGISQKLLARLRGSMLFKRVENGAPGTFEIDRELLRYRYLIAPGIDPRSFSQESLQNALKARLEALKSPFPTPFKALLAEDPTGAYQAMLRSWMPPSEINRAEGVWASGEGETALLLAVTASGGLELDQQQLVLATVRDAFDDLNSSGRHSLIISGPGVFAVQSRDIIRHESQILSLVASCVVALILLLAYRYLPYLLIAALPLLTALLAATLLTSLLFDELHGITLAFGITLLGVTIDYPIHLFSHLSKVRHPGQTMREIWATLRLSVITTCLGYLVLVMTDFSGLRQLGAFTLTGLITAAVCSRYLLPRLFSDPFVAPEPKGLRPLGLLQRTRLWPPALILLAALLSLGSLIQSAGPVWKDDIATLSPLPEELLQQDRALRRQLQATESNQLLVIRADDPERVLQICESVGKRMEIAIERQLLAGLELPSDYLPSQRNQMLRRQQLPTTEQLANNLRSASQGLPFRDDAFNRFAEAVEQSRRLPPMSYETALETSLKPHLERLMQQRPEGWLALIPLSGVSNPERLSRFVHETLPEANYFNLRQETSRLVAGFRQQILQRVELGAALMLLLLWLGLGSLRAAIRTLLPIALAILLTIGLLHVSGNSLNLFHLISLMLVLGIGIDYSLFFGRRETQAGQHLRTLHALSVCAASTAAVFAILAGSSIPVLHAIGQTVAIGVGMSYLATYALSRRPFTDHGFVINPASGKPQPSPARGPVQIALLLLAIAYPLALHGGVVNGNLLPASLILFSLLSLWGVLLVLKQRQTGWLMILLGALASAWLLIRQPETVKLLQLLPIFINGGLFILFATTLFPRQTPLITRFAQMMHEQALDHTAQDYSRKVTLFWASMFAFLTLESMLLAGLASAEIWSLFTNFINYLLVLAAFVVEYRIRVRRLAHLDHPGFVNFILRLRRIEWRSLM